MNDVLSWLGQAAIGSIGAAAVLTFLGKEWVKTRLQEGVKAEYAKSLQSHKADLEAENSKNLEVLKAQLKGEADLAQEKLRHELQIASARENLMFTRLHEKRIVAIESVHQKLHVLNASVGRYIHAHGPWQTSAQNQQLDELVKASEDFRSALVNTQIFLPRGITKSLDELDKTLSKIANEHTFVVNPTSARPNTELWLKQIELFQSDVLAAIEQLHEDIRIALGDRPE